MWGRYWTNQGLPISSAARCLAVYLCAVVETGTGWGKSQG